MLDWRVTATTIYCDAVDANVTIMVYKDRSTKCVALRSFAKTLPQTELRF